MRNFSAQESQQLLQSFFKSIKSVRSETWGYWKDLSLIPKQ